MKSSRLLVALVGVVALFTAAVVFIGCEVGSPSTIIRNVGVNYTGFYTNPNADTNTDDIVLRHTGNSIKSLDMRQNGDVLQAIDSNGIKFKGNISDPSEAGGNLVSSFELHGETTAGQQATFSGTLSTAGGSNSTSGSAEGTMEGTWIEPTLFSTFFAQATIPGAITHPGGGDGGSTNGSTSLTITPNAATVGISGSQVFTVTAGNPGGSLSWSISSGTGTLGSQSGNSITYTRTTTGSDTITARDQSSPQKSGSATIN